MVVEQMNPTCDMVMARERQRELLATAATERQAQRVRALARANRRAERARRELVRSRREAVRLRGELAAKQRS
jgi:hypothetical protein